MANGEITELIREAGSGNVESKDRLFELTYAKLHRMAKAKVGNREPLQTTALLHEAAIRILKNQDVLQNLPNRTTFYAVAGMAMRSVLVDHARRRSAAKRKPADGHQVFLHDDLLVEQFQQAEQLDLLALDESLEKLQSYSKRHHEIVMLRFFSGLNYREIAAHLGVSESTVEKEWRFARAWLRRSLGGNLAE